MQSLATMVADGRSHRWWHRGAQEFQIPRELKLVRYGMHGVGYTRDQFMQYYGERLGRKQFAKAYTYKELNTRPTVFDSFPFRGDSVSLGVTHTMLRWAGMLADERSGKEVIWTRVPQDAMFRMGYLEGLSTFARVFRCTRLCSRH